MKNPIDPKDFDSYYNHYKKEAVDLRGTIKLLFNCFIRGISQKNLPLEVLGKEMNKPVSVSDLFVHFKSCYEYGASNTMSERHLKQKNFIDSIIRKVNVNVWCIEGVDYKPMINGDVVTYLPRGDLFGLVDDSHNDYKNMEELSKNKASLKLTALAIGLEHVWEQRKYKAATQVGVVVVRWDDALHILNIGDYYLKCKNKKRGNNV